MADTAAPAGPIRSQAIEQKSAVYDRLERSWLLVEHLLGGTDAMREAGELYLPKEKGEDKDMYGARVMRSVLFPGFEESVDGIAARPFAEPLSIEGDLPAELEPLEEDADGENTALHDFAMEVFRTGVAYGGCHILVDYPSVPPDPEKVTKLEEQQKGLRPSLVLIPPRNLFRWKYVRDDSGKRVLDEVRIFDEEIGEDKDGSEIVVQLVRIYRRDTWEIWHKVEDETDDQAAVYELIASGPNKLGRVPLVTFRTKGRRLEVEPPLLKVGHLNVAHWQQQSDQDNILHVIRVPLLFGSGIGDEDNVAKGPVTLGNSRWLRSASPNANMRYVETTGQGATVGRERLRDLEAQMRMLGVMPFVEEAADVKAVAIAVDDSRGMSKVKAWVRRCETALREALSIAADWVDTKLSESLVIKLFDDFSAVERQASDLAELGRLYDRRVITAETLLSEFKRRGTLSDSVDVKKEVALSEQAAMKEAEEQARLMEEQGGAGGAQGGAVGGAAA